jgi:kynurenine formamidase
MSNRERDEEAAMSEEITRRLFVGAAGMAVASVSTLGNAQPSDTVRGDPQDPGNPRAARAARPNTVPDLSDDELVSMFQRCSNAGRWGADDELGTLNYITPAKRIAAAALVRTGELVSVGRDLSTTQTKTNPQPVEHIMMFNAPGSPSCGDYFTIAPHGMVVTHMDALCHFSWEDNLYNGRSAREAITAGGATWGSIHAQRHGIFTRGVLLDVAAARGVRWYVPDEFVTVADLEAAEARQNLRVGSGDAIFVRTGMEVMEAEEGEQDIYPRAGLHAQCVEWMHEREVSVYGGDCIEKLPYPSERFTSALHMIALASMGMPILDWPSLTELAETCERLGRWDYLLTTAPLRLPGGTASPINPLCLF